MTTNDDGFTGDSDRLPESCPYCGFGECTEYPQTEYYTAGYGYICDCGYCTARPKMTYKDFSDAIKNINNRRRMLLDKIEKLKKLLTFSGRIAIADEYKRVQHNAYDRLSDLLKNTVQTPHHTKVKKLEMHGEWQELNRQDEALLNEWFELRQAYPCYASIADDEGE